MTAGRLSERLCRESWAAAALPTCAPLSADELDVHGRPQPSAFRTRERHRQIHERLERGDSQRAIARELRLSRGTVARSARDVDVQELLAAATRRPSLIDDYRLYLHHCWSEECTNAAALTREIRQLGYCSDIDTVRRHLRPYRVGAVPVDVPLPSLTGRRVTDWMMRPELLTDAERRLPADLCERSPALAATAGTLAAWPPSCATGATSTSPSKSDSPTPASADHANCAASPAASAATLPRSSQASIPLTAQQPSKATSPGSSC